MNYDNTNVLSVECSVLLFTFVYLHCIRAWAVELMGNMSYNGSDHNSAWSWFLISIQMTPEGFQNYKQVRLMLDKFRS